MYKEIDLKNVRESKMKYRKAYDSAAMKELTESIKSHGVLEPIIVREVTAGDFEIVAGHRRHLASIEAGLEIIPAIVKELTDEAALEIQVIENSQREDPNPMEEAEGFKALLDMGKHTTETLAERIGHPVKYVLGRLKLLTIAKPAQKMVASGELSMGKAVLITRLNSKKQQKDFLKAITEYGGMTIDEATHELDSYSMSLKNVPFDKEECSTCPYRSLNQTVLFPELKKTDECTDAKCFKLKTMAHYQAIIDKKKDEGFKIITEKSALKNSIHIAAPGTKSFHGDMPRKYKSECLKCLDNHVWYLFEDKNAYNGPRIEFGEVCLDSKCLREMNSPKNKTSDGSSTEPDEESWSVKEKWKEKATACRDRFLDRALPAKVAASDVLIKRYLIYTLIQPHHYDDRIAEIVQEFYSSFDTGRHTYNEDIYAAVACFPIDRLDEALAKIIEAVLPRADHDVLECMSIEAKIVMCRDFEVDEEFLKGKTKDELIVLIKELELDVDVAGSAKKGKIIEAILETDITGLVPKEIKDVCKTLKAPVQTDTVPVLKAPKVVWCPKCHYDSAECECEEAVE